MQQATSNDSLLAPGATTPLHQRFLLWLASQAGGMDVATPWSWRYATALTALIVATAMRQLVDPVLGDRAPYGMYLLAVIFVSWKVGLGPALVTVAGGTLLGRYFFDPPRGSLWIATESNQISLIMSLTVG